MASYPYASGAGVIPVSPHISTYPNGGGGQAAYPSAGGGITPAHSPYLTSAAAATGQSSYPGAPGLAPGSAASPYAGSTSGSTLVGHSPGAIYAGASPLQQYPGLAHGAGAGVGVQGAAPVGGQLTIGAQVLSPQQQQQPFSANVQPGAVTYTTTVDANGRVTYHHFRAEPATYRSPQGVTYTGIQWVNTDQSSSPPVGVPPAGPEVLASFRGQLPGAGAGTGVVPGAAGAGRDPYYREDRGYGGYGQQWDKDEMKRIKKEEKEAAKRAAAWESERRAREKAEEKELRKARERDAQREREAEAAAATARNRRLSNATGPAPMAGYGSSAGGAAAAYEREREIELERRMGELSVSGGGGLSAEYGAAGTRSRRQSMSMPEPGVPGRGPVGSGAGGTYYDEPDAYGERERDRDRYDDYGGRGAGSGFGAGGTLVPGGFGAQPERSPYRATGTLPPAIGPGGVPVYPRGHIREGQPIPGGAAGVGANLGVGVGAGGYGPPSRSHSPAPIVPGTAPYPLASGYAGGGFGGHSPRMGGGMPLAGGRGGYDAAQEAQLLASPEAFSRPINRAQPFTPFEITKVQDMDDFLLELPRLPPVLTTHDVVSDDWIRLMNDLSLAWKGRLPLPDFASDRQPKRSTLVADLLDLWNSAFFLPRGVELVLYKGRERRSGRGAGRPEFRLPRIEQSDSFSESDTDDSPSDVDDGDAAARYRNYGSMYGSGRGGYNDYERLAAQKREARLYRQQRKEEKKRRNRERKQRRKEQAKTYSLYMCYVPVNDYAGDRDYQGVGRSARSIPGEFGGGGEYMGTARSGRSIHSAHSSHGI